MDIEINIPDPPVPYNAETPFDMNEAVSDADVMFYNE